LLPPEQTPTEHFLKINKGAGKAIHHQTRERPTGQTFCSVSSQCGVGAVELKW